MSRRLPAMAHDSCAVAGEAPTPLPPACCGVSCAAAVLSTTLMQLSAACLACRGVGRAWLGSGQPRKAGYRGRALCKQAAPFHGLVPMLRMPALAACTLRPPTLLRGLPALRLITSTCRYARSAPGRSDATCTAVASLPLRNARGRPGCGQPPLPPLHCATWPITGAGAGAAQPANPWLQGRRPVPGATTRRT